MKAKTFESNAKSNDGPLIPNRNSPNEPLESCGRCRVVKGIAAVLFVCGILLVGLSVITWHFHDTFDEDYDETNWNLPISEFGSKVPSSSSDDPLEGIGCCKAATIITVVLFVCGVLALGLSAVIWHFYDKFDADKGHTTTTTPLPPTEQKRIVGVYTNHQTKDITKSQLEKLTHAVFSYIRLDSNGTIQFENDKAKQRFLNLRDKSRNATLDVKVMISIGGPHHFENFSDVIANPTKRKTFTDSIIAFLKKHRIDGVDLFWKWPQESEKFQFSAFLRDLKSNLNEAGNTYILSITAPAAGIEHWTSGFDMDAIVDCVDFVNILSMDYYGPWPNQWGTPCGPTAPLYSGYGPKENFNVDFTMQYYAQETRQPQKFNIVIPFFARLWKNVEGSVEPGKEAFRDVELKNNETVGDVYMSRWTVEHEGWKLVPYSWDEDSKSAFVFDPVARTYLTFENERSIKAKKDYVNEKNLGGVWIWFVDMDDNKNSLLNALSSEKSSKIR